jgi:hypothetical protein
LSLTPPRCVPVRKLPVMATWTLEPHDTFTPDPGCPHCIADPGYQHRHWEKRGPEPARENGPVMRFFMHVWGNGQPVPAGPERAGSVAPLEHPRPLFGGQRSQQVP